MFLKKLRKKRWELFQKGSSTIILVLLLAAGAGAQNAFVGMGDSIGEGVQSADASQWTQPYNYLNLIAWRGGVPFPLPLIASNLFGVVGDTSSRFRIDPAVNALNLAVSGADVSSLLRDRADGVLNSETDLVLLPRVGSQMEIAESLQPVFVACWIGNNDALSAVTAFDQLDASQLTSVTDFTRDFTEIATRLQIIGSRVVFGNIPDVSNIGFLLTREEVIVLLGSAFGMAPGDRTSVITVILIRFGLASPTLLSNPNFILTASEIAVISRRIADFNTVIQQTAVGTGMAVADIHQQFENFAANPPTFFGIPLTRSFLGGLFSLDGIHPSNIGHALIANEFIQTFNTRYGTGIPPLSDQELNWFFLTDPFQDRDGDGKITGRFGAGLLETLAALIGISGDPDDFDSTDTLSMTTTGANTLQDSLLAEEHERISLRRLRKMSQPELLEEFRGIFGLGRFQKQRSPTGKIF